MILIPVLTLAVLLPQETPGPRNWAAGEAGVQFVEGTTSPRVDPVGDWSGQAAISVRCTVASDGSLDDCAVVEESRPRLLSHRSARVNVGKMRLLLGETGPRPGDTLTVEIAVRRAPG